MKELYQLVKIISPNKIKGLETVSSGGEEGSNIQRLYYYLTQNEGLSEEELAFKFYSGKHRMMYFNRLKQELKGRLVNTLFLIDATGPQYAEVAQAYYHCYKNATAIKILLAKGARQAAVSLARETFRKAELFEFTDILLSLSKDLRFHYGTILGNSKQFEFYNKQVHYYQEVYWAELKAEEYYSALALTFSVSGASKAEYSEQASSYAEEMEQAMKRYHSYRLNLYAFTVIALRYEIANDHENTIATCKRALKYFEKRKRLSSRQALYNFSYRMLSSFILLRRLKEGEKVALRCLQWIDKGLFNWFKAMEYLFIICLHAEKYQKAYEVCMEVIAHDSFSRQYSTVQELWHINEAYIYYFILAGIVKVEGSGSVKKFRVSKLLNEVPTYSKDKRGSNISVLILQILFLLQQKQYDKIIDRVESLRTYTHRYLRRDETFRSNCFIKLLTQLPASNFHKAAVIRKSRRYWEKLKSVGIIHNQSADLEVVPYEKLWKFVLNSLEGQGS